MFSDKTLIKLTFIFGCLSLISLLLCHLALTDIAHGEPNVSAEWNILRVSAVIIFTFIISTFYIFWRIHKKMA
jgi:hypothetical protein